MYRYKTRGTCASAIEIEAEGDVVTEVRFVEGCAGNTQGVASLAKGMKIGELVGRLKGIQCRGKTSCPDQLARALEAMIQEREAK